MAHIHIDEKVFSNICNEDLIAVIQGLISDELSKPEFDIDADFVEECVNAMLEIEQAEDNSFVPLVPLIKRQDFIDRITATHHGTKKISKFARVAIVAATLAASTLTANAAVEAVTGVNLLEQVGEKVQSRLGRFGLANDTGIDYAEGEDDDDEITTLPTTEETVTVTEETTQAPTSQPENTTYHTTTQPTTAYEGIDNAMGEYDDDDEETTTVKETTTEKETTTTESEMTKPTTTNKYIPATTEQAITEPQKPETEVVMTGLTAIYDTRFRSDYIYGEELSYEGMTLIAVFSDGSEMNVSLDDCSYTSGIDMNKTGDYTLTVTYKRATVRVNITVRPDEETRGSEICSNEDYDYLLTKNGAYITKYKGSETDIILNEVDENYVIAISAGAFAESDIQSISCDNVKKIFDNAFKDCKALTIAVAPELEYIGNSAFEGCTQLENAVSSTSLKHIGKKAYKDSGITQIVLPKWITEIPESLCENCSSLQAVDLKGEVTSINSFAFSECTALESVTGTEKINSVSDFAFFNDTLVDFDSPLPELETAGEYAFAYCNSAGITRLSDNIKEIGQYAFAYCFKLKEVEIPASITVIPEGAFRGAHISELTLNEGVEEIDDCAFMSTEIVSLHLPNSLKKIGAYGLYSIKLKEAYFGKNVEYIGSSAFYKRKNLMLYVYDDSVPLEYAVANSISYTIINEED